ncbi:MAG: hypothetical protein U5O39_10785 [Gammaproteobacteria bacterium]|nr:hypothetical protein [Gammaproteobacteria bacterium]
MWEPAERRAETDRADLSPELLAEAIEKCTDAYRHEEWNAAMTECFVAADHGDALAMYLMAEMTFDEE